MATQLGKQGADVLSIAETKAYDALESEFAEVGSCCICFDTCGHGSLLCCCGLPPEAQLDSMIVSRAFDCTGVSGVSRHGAASRPGRCCCSLHKDCLSVPAIWHSACCAC